MEDFPGSDIDVVEKRACPACGMPEKSWTHQVGQGRTVAGQSYCCEGCATGQGCICVSTAPAGAREGIAGEAGGGRRLTPAKPSPKARLR